MRKGQVEFNHAIEPDGSVTLQITVKGATINPDSKFERFWIADTGARELPILIDCNGISRRPKMIFKMYCRIPYKEARMMRDAVSHAVSPPPPKPKPISNDIKAEIWKRIPIGRL